MPESARATSLWHAVDSLAASKFDHLAAIEWPASEISGNTSLTYGELATLSVKLACGLRDALPHDGSPLASLMCRGCAMFALYIAASRSGHPWLPLSLDHKDQAIEERRWRQAIEIVDPCAVVVDSEGEARWSPVPGSKPAMLKYYDLAVSQLEIANFISISSSPLALVFTGGTTRASRCVEITQAMVSHELYTYREAVPAKPFGEKVLQLSSAYWGAALLGEIDLGLACGAVLVFGKCATPEDVWQATLSNGVTILGLVPALLGQIPLEEARLSSRVHTLVTWADACPAALSRKWRANGISVVELLIATEYWLSFYCKDNPGPLGRPCYSAVSNCNWKLVIANSGGWRFANEGEVGELWLSGPTVTTGYRGQNAEENRFCVLGEVRYWRTSDMARYLPNNRFEFLGRSDMMTKVGGKWVDLAAVEDQLRQIDGVTEAAIVTLPTSGFPSCSVVCASGAISPANACACTPSAEICSAHRRVRSLRAAIAKSGIETRLHLVPQECGGLPRKAMTRKLDLSALEESLRPSSNSWIATHTRRSAKYCMKRSAVAVCGCLIATAKWPSWIIPRLVAAPFAWLSVVGLTNFSFPRSEEKVNGLKPLLFLTTLFLPRWNMFLAASPGFAWTFATGRTLGWAALFWTAGPWRLERHALQTLKLWHRLFTKHCPVAEKSSKLFVALQDIRRKFFNWGIRERFSAAASALSDFFCPQDGCCRLMAYYTDAGETFDGNIWMDSSGYGRHGYVKCGAPRVDLSRAVTFRPRDSMELLGTDKLPKEFTILVAMRLQPPRFRMILRNFTREGSEVIGSTINPLGSVQELHFELMQDDCEFPRVVLGQGHPYGAMWRVLLVNGDWAPPLVSWPDKVPEGAELTLQEFKREEYSLASDVVVAGTFGPRAGCAWWNEDWQTWSQSPAGYAFHVIAIRSPALAGGTVIPGSVIMDGKPVPPPVWSDRNVDNEDATVSQIGDAFVHKVGSLPRRRDSGALGVNTAGRRGTQSHSAILELAVYEGRVDDEEVERLIRIMADRSKIAQIAVPEVEEPHKAAVASVIEALRIGDDTREKRLFRAKELADGGKCNCYANEEQADDVDLPQFGTRAGVNSDAPVNLTGVSPEDISHSHNESLSSRKQLLSRILASVIGPFSMDEPLAGADSLRIMALAGSLRTEMRASVSTSALQRVASVGGNLDCIEILVEEALNNKSIQGTPRPKISSCYKVWCDEDLYDAPMCWTLESPIPIDVAALKRSLRKLCQRHIPLGVRSERPECLWKEIMVWTSGSAIVAETFSASGLFQGKCGSVFLRLLVYSLEVCWPRHVPQANFEPPVREVLAETWKDVGSAIMKARDHFRPPCTFLIVHCQESGSDYLQMSVSHAICDGSSFGALRGDLLSLYEAERAGQDAKLPEIGNAMALLEDRLFSSLRFIKGEEQDEKALAQMPYLAGWSPPHARVPLSVWGYKRFVRIRQGAGDALRRVGKALNVQSDVMLIAALACAISRCDSSPSVRLTLSVPMRDGPEEGSMIGLFTDWRDLDVSTHPLQSLASVVLQVGDDIRSRRWVRGRVAQTEQRIHINLVSAEEANDRGFVHKVYLGCMRPPIPGGHGGTFMDRPLQILGWQVGSNEWALRLRGMHSRYPPSWANSFATSLREVIGQLQTDVWVPLHPTMRR